MNEGWRNGGFGLYVHWPYCTAKCPYCDFNSHVSSKVNHQDWKQAYLSEIARISAETGPRVLNSIFFGGGTPSLMEPETVAAIIKAATSAWTPANDIEVTLEANPGSVESGKFVAFKDAGVNRISMGVQALNDTDLRRLGRIHTVDEARQAFEIARTTFDRVSFDLIYARQHQSLDMWRTELNEALSMAIDHLSLYQLTIEPGTVFHARHKVGKLPALPSDDSSADMYELTQELTAKAGMPAYEVSNHAKPGSESRHNLIYWRYGDYAGIGPGSHGRLTLDGRKYATESLRMPSDWLNAASQGNGEIDREILSGSAQATEYALMSMRLNEGLDLDRFTQLNGGAVDQDKVASLVDLGLVVSDENRLRTTVNGRPVLNAVLNELLRG